MHDTEILLTAYELYKFGNHPSVVALCSDVLLEAPDNLAMRFILVRSLIALKRYDEARTHLGESLEIAPKSAEAYDLLGDLATCRNDQRSASIFYGEARRLAPDDPQSNLHPNNALFLNQPVLNQPTVAVEKLPAATAAVGCTFESTIVDEEEPSLFSPFNSPNAESLDPVLDSLAESSVERVSRRHAVGSESDIATATEVSPLGYFGQYLMQAGILTHHELERALSYHRVAGLRLGDAVIKLGYASQDEVEWAALGYHGRVQA